MSGEVAPVQIGFDGGVNVELLQPGTVADGFVRRFPDKGGPGPHHLTFMVPRLSDFVATTTRYGLPAIGAHSSRSRSAPRPSCTQREAGSEHSSKPSSSATSNPTPSPPPGFPEPGPQSHQLSWVAVRVADLSHLPTSFGEATDASLIRAESGARSVLLEWEDRRRLLLLDGSGGGARRPRRLPRSRCDATLTVVRSDETGDMRERPWTPGIRIVVCR